MLITCSHCKVLKDENEFRGHAQGKYGKHNQCKKCEKTYQNENRDKHRACCKRYRESHKQEVAEYNKMYQGLHPEKYRARQKKYRGKPLSKQKKVINEQNRRARKCANGGDLSAKDWDYVKNLYGNRCLSCGKQEVNLTIDHVVPIKLGGLHSIENIQPLCPSCNSKKWIRIIDFRPFPFTGDR